MRRMLLLSAVALAAAASATGAERLAVKEAAAARKIYVAKCAKCHKFYEPKQYTGEDWDRWMGKMSRKSKLSKDQEALLKRYLVEYRDGKIEKVK